MSQQWAITEKISELETNYQYMLHYLIEGKKDPEQQHIYEKLIRDLYMVADDAAEHLLLQESSALFFERSRQQQVRLPLSMDEYRSIITRQADTFSFISLLEEGEEKDRRLKENELTHENTLQDLFYSLFVSPRANTDLIASYRAFMDDDLIPVYDKSVFLSALTMNLLQRSMLPRWNCSSMYAAAPTRAGYTCHHRHHSHLPDLYCPMVALSRVRQQAETVVGRQAV